MTIYLNDSALIVGKLTIERCQNYLAHLHALMHVCRPDDLGMDPVAAESARKIMIFMEQELKASADILDASTLQP